MWDVVELMAVRVKMKTLSLHGHRGRLPVPRERARRLGVRTGARCGGASVRHHRVHELPVVLAHGISTALFPSHATSPLFICRAIFFQARYI